MIGFGVVASMAAIAMPNCKMPMFPASMIIIASGMFSGMCPNKCLVGGVDAADAAVIHNKGIIGPTLLNQGSETLAQWPSR